MISTSPNQARFESVRRDFRLRVENVIIPHLPVNAESWKNALIGS